MREDSLADSRQRQQLIVKHINKTSISCTSMVVTVFGDVVSQHGGWIWLGSLINALGPFGFNERLVRTAVYRLLKNDWLKVNKVGRRSYYCFTETAKGHYDKAARRIYTSEQPDWDGSWILVAPLFIAEEKKEVFRKSLIWQGFNTLVSGMFAHPSSDRTSLDEIIYEQDLIGDVAVLSAKTEDFHSQAAIKKLVKNRWNLSELEVFYNEFLNFYRPLCQQVAAKRPNASDSFLLRALLIHDYRRILLRDPDLPEAMLPHGWLGHEAYDLVKRVYKVLVNCSMDYIQQDLENAQGPLPKAHSLFFTRFGGLD